MRKPLNRSACKTGPGAAFLIGIAWLLLLPVLAHAEWYKDYESAMDLLKKGENSEAIPRLQAAISQKNEEGSNIKFYGMKFGDYFPHYFLGMAYYSQKNYEASVREFELSEKSGAIQRKRDLYEKMSSMRTLAKAQLSLKEPTIASNPPVTVPVNPPANQPVNPPVNQPSNPPVNQPSQNTNTVTPLNVQNPPTTTVTQQNTTTPGSKPPVQPGTQPPVTAPPINAGEEAVKVMMKNGARKYFEGDYDSAISYLSSAIEVNPNEPSAHFLLGCAYASKYLLTGSDNADLLKNASAAFQRLKKLNPRYQPRNKLYFSPAVLDLYSRT